MNASCSGGNGASLEPQRAALVAGSTHASPYMILGSSQTPPSLVETSATEKSPVAEISCDHFGLHPHSVFGPLSLVIGA